jgi:hypothetical protein
MKNNGYDIIADIHGHADKLKSLLVLLGYEEREGCYRHPERKVIFLGDFIDRGPEIPEVLRIARSMVVGGSALAVMGNHELNAIAYHTPDGNGGYLRPHIGRNKAQHAETVAQFASRESELRNYLDWFASLPLFIDLGGLRIVHACWDEGAIRALGTANKFDPGMLVPGTSPENRIRHDAVNLLLKGPEIAVPDGLAYGPEGRTDMRVKWWLNEPNLTYRSAAMQVPPELLTDELLIDEDRRAVCGYPTEAPPVIVGHYGYAKPPEPMTPNVAIIDLGAYKGGQLCAYRWTGERHLDAKNFVTVS